MTSHKHSIEALDTAIEQLHGEIFGNQRGIEELEKQIAVYRKQIESFRSQIASHEAVIILLKGTET